MAHFQGQQHGHPATRVDEYGNPVAAGHGITGTQQPGYGCGDAGVHGRQAGYGATGTGTHDAAVGGPHTGGGLGAGHNTAGYGNTGTGVAPLDAGGLGAGHTPAGYGATATRTHGTGTDAHGIAPPTSTTATDGGQFQPAREEHKTGGILHRSGSSSSSSSSEDDGMGGRRKKGMTEKIKEKLPGGHKGNQQQAMAPTGGYGPTTTGPTAGATVTQPGYTGPTQPGYAGATTGTAGTHEKKGVMEKIKEKLPGHH